MTKNRNIAAKAEDALSMKFVANSRMPYAGSSVVTDAKTGDCHVHVSVLRMPQDDATKRLMGAFASVFSVEDLRTGASKTHVALFQAPATPKQAQQLAQGGGVCPVTYGPDRHALKPELPVFLPNPVKKAI